MLQGLLYVIHRAGIEDLDYRRIHNTSEIMLKLVKHAQIVINLPTPGWNDVQRKFIKGWGSINYNLLGIFPFEQNEILSNECLK